MRGNELSACLLGRSARLDSLLVVPEAVEFIGVGVRIPARKNLERRNFDRDAGGNLLAVGEGDGL